MEERRDRPRMRPLFSIELDVPAEAVLARLRESLARKGAPAAGTVMPRHAELRTPEHRAHFWSPNLSLEIARAEGEPSLLRGRFAPAPAVWMLFMGVYGVLGLSATLALMFGISQCLAGEPPWAWAGVPVALACMAFVYGATFIGQGLGAAEMYVLRSFVDDAIEAARAGAAPTRSGSAPSPLGGVRPTP